MKSQKDVNEIFVLLEEMYPDAHCELDYTKPFELLIATVLSAQTTDVKVNQVTPTLFGRYGTPKKLAEAPLEELEKIIRNIGLYKNKSKNIKNLSKMLIEEYSGEVPDSREELVKLPGVGRKTANVVLSNVFKAPVIAVDTHVFRVSNRLGLANADNVEKTELQLEEVIKEDLRWFAHHALIFHGRRVCKARKPECELCKLTIHCEYYNKLNKSI